MTDQENKNIPSPTSEPAGRKGGFSQSVRGKIAPFLAGSAITTAAFLGLQTRNGGSVAARDEDGKIVYVQPDPTDVAVSKEALKKILTDWKDKDNFGDIIASNVGVIIGSWIIDMKQAEGTEISSAYNNIPIPDKGAAKVTMTRIMAVAEAIKELPEEKRKQALATIKELHDKLYNNDPRSPETLAMMETIKPLGIGKSYMDSVGQSLFNDQSQTGDAQHLSKWVTMAPKGKQVVADAKIDDHDVWLAIDVLDMLMRQIEPPVPARTR